MFDLDKLAKQISSSENKNVNTTAKEIAYDFDKRQIILKDGQPQYVYGAEAVKVWIYKALSTQRGFYPVYSWNFGQDYLDVIGSRMSHEAMNAELKRITEKALYVNNDILELTDFKFTLVDESMTVQLTVNTVYGEITLEVNN